jgi:hypothetical protein
MDSHENTVGHCKVKLRPEGQCELRRVTRRAHRELWSPCKALNFYSGAMRSHRKFLF